MSVRFVPWSEVTAGPRRVRFFNRVGLQLRGVLRTTPSISAALASQRAAASHHGLGVPAPPR
jgi:hypothetical protein